MTKDSKKNHDSEYILKMGFVVIGVIVVLAIIIASWIWNLIFDPEHFDVNIRLISTCQQVDQCVSAA